MTAQYEGHVRTMMATGGSGRQVRDNLVLCASHFWMPRGYKITITINDGSGKIAIPLFLVVCIL
jgi:hypothetical protein